jgi:hypothetical protein
MERLNRAVYAVLINVLKEISQLGCNLRGTVAGDYFMINYLGIATALWPVYS